MKPAVAMCSVKQEASGAAASGSPIRARSSSSVRVGASTIGMERHAQHWDQDVQPRAHARLDESKGGTMIGLPQCVLQVARDEQWPILGRWKRAIGGTVKLRAVRG